MRHNRTVRGGMTLIELLVAAALCLIIMAILARLFATGTDTLRQLKSAGDMQRQLRAAAEKIKADLAAPHFDDPAVAGGKLSEVRFDLSPNAVPSSGVVRVVQVGSAYQEFLQDPNANQYFPPTAREYSTIANPAPKTSAKITPPLNGVTVYQARPNGNAHALQLAVKLDGKTRQTVFTAPRPPTAPGFALDNKFDNLVQNPASYASRWAVVTYFLVDSGTKTLNGGPLYDLHRRVQLLAEVPGAMVMTADPNYSLRPVSPSGAAPYAVNTVNDLTLVAYRPGSTAVPALATSPAFNAFMAVGDGSDVVLSNVTSFEIKANWTGNYRKLTATPTLPGDLPNFDYPFDDFPPTPPVNQAGGSSTYDVAPRIFDTAVNPNSGENLLVVPATAHTRVRVTAFQIKLRVWDPNQRTARQVTLVQDM